MGQKRRKISPATALFFPTVSIGAQWTPCCSNDKPQSWPLLSKDINLWEYKAYVGTYSTLMAILPIGTFFFLLLFCRPPELSWTPNWNQNKYILFSQSQTISPLYWVLAFKWHVTVQQIQWRNYSTTHFWMNWSHLSLHLSLFGHSQVCVLFSSTYVLTKCLLRRVWGLWSSSWCVGFKKWAVCVW